MNQIIIVSIQTSDNSDEELARIDWTPILCHSWHSLFRLMRSLPSLASITTNGNIDVNKFFNKNFIKTTSLSIDKRKSGIY